MKLENRLLEMFGHGIVITHKQLAGSPSAPSDAEGGGFVAWRAEGLWCVCLGHGGAASAHGLQDKLLNKEMRNSTSDSSLCDLHSGSSGLRPS